MVDYLRAITEKLGDPRPQGGGEYDYPCPFCPAKFPGQRPSTLHVNVDKEAAICHRCGFGTRNLHYLVQRIGGEVDERRGANFLESIEGILYRPRRKYQPPNFMGMPREAKPLRPPYRGLSKRAYKYCRSRHLTDEDIALLDVHYCREGTFSGHVVFPIRMFDEEVVYFTTRKAWGFGPKSRNAKGERGNIIFNLNNAKGSLVFIAEGPFSALAFGTDRGVALLGNSCSDEQALALARVGAQEYVVCLDQDKREKTLEVACKLDSYVDGKVSYILLEDGDPDDNRADLGRYIEGRTPVAPSQKFFCKKL